MLKLNLSKLKTLLSLTSKLTKLNTEKEEHIELMVESHHTKPYHVTFKFLLVKKKIVFLQDQEQIVKCLENKLPDLEYMNYIDYIRYLSLYLFKSNLNKIN